MKSIISLLWRVRSTNAFCHFALNWLFIFSASLFVISTLINFTIWGESVCVCVLWESEWSSMINHFLLTLVGVCTAACFHVHLCASKCVCVTYICSNYYWRNTHTHTDSAARGEGVNSEVRGQGLNNHWAVLAQTLVQWLTTSAIH